jgi:hypothetical protein
MTPSLANHLQLDHARVCAAVVAEVVMCDSRVGCRAWMRRQKRLLRNLNEDSAAGAYDSTIQPR